MAKSVEETLDNIIKKVSKHIPGFRSDKKWKKIIAVIYYIFSLLMVTVSIGALLIMVSIPFILFAIVDIAKNKKKSAIMVLVITIIAFGSGIAIESSQPNDKGSTSKSKVTLTSKKLAEDKKAQEDAKAKAESQKKAEEDAIKNSTPESVTTTSAKKLFKNKFISVGYADNAKTNLVLTVEASENLSNSLIKHGMQRDVQDIVKKLYKNEKFQTLNEFTVIHKMNFVDTYGNKSFNKAQSVTLSAATIQKINWSNFDYSNFPKVADDYYLHPCFYK